MMKEDDEAKEVLQRLLEKLGEASGVLVDLQSYLEISERRARRVIKRIIRAGLILVAGYLIVLVLVGDSIRQAHQEAERASKATSEAKASIRKNRLAIRVGCTLLRNAIIQSGAGSAPRKEPLTPQEQLTGLYIQEIMEGMTSTELKKTQRLMQQVEKRGGPITIPDCDDIARHPEKIIKDIDKK